MKVVSIATCLGLLVLGCDNAEPQTAVPAAEAPAPTAIQKPSVDVNAKLEYDTRIETRDGKSTVYWTAKVPTGGWTMATDAPPLVEERNTLWWVRVYVTIEAPASNEIVTQGVQTLTGSFEADKKINRVEFSVRRKVKGEKYDFQPTYGIVKTGPDWVTDEDKAAK